MPELVDEDIIVQDGNDAFGETILNNVVISGKIENEEDDNAFINDDDVM